MTPGAWGGEGAGQSLFWALQTNAISFSLFVQSLSRVRLCSSTPGSHPPPISQSLLKFTSTQSVMPANHLIICSPLLLLPSIFPSIRVFSSESALCIKRPKYWSFSFSISPSEGYSGLISMRIDWFDLLAEPSPAAVKSLQSCPTLCNPIDVSHQAPLPLFFSRHEHWSGLPFPSPMQEREK